MSNQYEEPSWKDEVKVKSGPKFFLEVKAYKGKDSAQITVWSFYAKQTDKGTRIWMPVNKEDIDSLIASLMELSKFAE